VIRFEAVKTDSENTVADAPGRRFENCQRSPLSRATRANQAKASSSAGVMVFYQESDLLANYQDARADESQTAIVDK
jgi:hypothetical protein